MKKTVFAVLIICALWVSSAVAGDKVVYTVKPGDTLGELMYTWRVQGVEINKLHIWNSDLGTQVKVGQKITYFLPERVDVKKLTEQEIQKVVAETMARMEKLKTPAPATSVMSTAPVQTPKQQQVESIFPRYVQVLGTILMALTLMALFVYVYCGSMRAKRKVKNQTMDKPASEEEISINGYLVRVLYAPSEDKWYSPFKNASGGQIYERTRADIIGSVSRCLKSRKFYEEFEKLLASGKIKQL